jgi:hypothetical protein
MEALDDYREYGPAVLFSAMMNTLAIIMAYYPDDIEHMVEVIGETNWIALTGKWRRLIDNGYEPVLTREPQNYQ